MANSTDGNSPDFSTLAGIMDYFNKVPFETFKKELNGWFVRDLPNKRPDLIKENGDTNLPLGLQNLIEKIFKIAEERDHSQLN